MGIRYLNKFLRNNCTQSIRCINMSDLSGKRIVVDISIYLYKYEADNMLLENIYLMLSIFRYYNIIPIFIFDGKPPREKNYLLKKRKDDKIAAQEEYNRLVITLQNVIDDDEKEELVATMDQLKKQFIYINKSKIEKVKELIRAYGATYYDAPGEADALCAMLVIKKKVWACLSEDMDLFVYGCNRVLRYLSLMNHNVVLYHTKGILEELKMTHNEFKKICILSGTDYNFSANGNNENINLHQTLKLFRRFKNNNNNMLVNTDICFYDWIRENTNYINDIELLHKVYSMFDISNYNDHLQNFKYIKIINGPIMQNNIKELMKEEGFIFL
jgi:5'-3' exonuclease